MGHGDRTLFFSDLVFLEDEAYATQQSQLRQRIEALQGKPLLKLDQLNAVEQAGLAEPWLRREYDRFSPLQGKHSPGQ